MFGNQSTQAQNTNYGAAIVQNQPKELGLIQRVEGVRSGLDEIHSKLMGLGERISGGISGETKPEPMPSGIPSNLTIAEQRIRQILSLLETFNSTF